MSSTIWWSFGTAKHCCPNNIISIRTVFAVYMNFEEQMCQWIMQNILESKGVGYFVLNLQRNVHNVQCAHFTVLKVADLLDRINIPDICHRHHRRCLCKKKLTSVNFYRFNAKNWQFTVYFAEITQKIGNLLCILP